MMNVVALARLTGGDLRPGELVIVVIDAPFLLQLLMYMCLLQALARERL